MSRIDFVTGAPEKYAGLVDRLSTVGERLASVLDGRSAEELRRDPPDGWSVQRILGHVAFLARENGTFIYQVATMSDPKRKSFPSGHEDPDLLQRDPRDLAQTIEDELAKTVEFLSRTPDAAWGRPGFIRGARRSLRQIVEGHANHFDEHIGQIAQVLSQSRVAS